AYVESGSVVDTLSWLCVGSINQPQQMVLWNVIFQSEVVEQRFRTGVSTHHAR
ncbi:MAG: hypothetical protein QOK38_1733, partial [Acidobacteriaceae bacterium]|nr:hypothetical protein [Acidobacteriaceae bacterium]